MARPKGGDAVSPAAKLCGFLLLLALVCAGAYKAGARLGPVATTQQPASTQPASGGGSSGHMPGMGR
ncbi:MAG TPA: hypothetical protein VMG38_16565 [Trebonia sp.]|nr:hypothetical protein [Trebonia sp.]